MDDIGKNHLYRLLDKLTVDQLGLAATIGFSVLTSVRGNSLILGNSISNFTIGAIIAVIVIISILIGRWLRPEIKLHRFKQANHERADELAEEKVIDLTRSDHPTGQVEVSMKFRVPEYQDEVYVSFELDEHGIGMNNYDPVNFDFDKSITYQSGIDEFRLDLTIEPDEELNNSKIPLRIVNRLNGREIERIQVSG